MIALEWNSPYYPTSLEADQHIQGLMASYRALPRHIARKHLMAAMRKILRPGIPILRKNTPPLGTRRGRRKKGEKARSTGDLRRAVTVRTGQTGRNNGFESFVWGVLGYKAGFQSRKAIWLQYGTSAGIRSYEMLEKTMAEFGPTVAQQLAHAMAAALPKAIAEVSGGMNPGRE